MSTSFVGKVSQHIALETLAVVFVNNLRKSIRPQPWILTSYDKKSGQLTGIISKQSSPCESYQQFWQLYDKNDLSENEKRDIYWRVYLETNCNINCLRFCELAKQIIESGGVIVYQNRTISLDEIYISQCSMTIEDIKPRIQFKIRGLEPSEFPMFHTQDRNLSQYLSTHGEKSAQYLSTMEYKQSLDNLDPKLHESLVFHFFISVVSNNHPIIHLDFSGISYCNTGDNPWFTNRVKYYQALNDQIPISIYETKHVGVQKYQYNDTVCLRLAKTETLPSDHPDQYLYKQIRALEHGLKFDPHALNTCTLPTILMTPNKWKRLGEHTKLKTLDSALVKGQCSALVKGSRVLLFGFKNGNYKLLNGAKGTIITTLNKAKQRYGVRVGGKKVSVNINNIALIFPSVYLSEKHEYMREAKELVVDYFDMTGRNQAERKMLLVRIRQDPEPFIQLMKESKEDITEMERRVLLNRFKTLCFR